MRIAVSLLTAVYFIAAAEAAPTPKPSIIDQIKRPSPLGEQHAGGMCQTQCQWIGNQQFCNTHCF